MTASLLFASVVTLQYTEVQRFLAKLETLKKDYIVHMSSILQFQHYIVTTELSDIHNFTYVYKERSKPAQAVWKEGKLTVFPEMAHTGKS